MEAFLSLLFKLLDGNWPHPIPRPRDDRELDGMDLLSTGEARRFLAI